MFNRSIVQAPKSLQRGDQRNLMWVWISSTSSEAAKDPFSGVILPPRTIYIMFNRSIVQAPKSLKHGDQRNLMWVWISSTSSKAAKDPFSDVILPPRTI